MLRLAFPLRIILLYAGILISTGNLLHGQEVPSWYKNAGLFINIDTYSRNFDVSKTAGYRHDIRDFLERARPDVIEKMGN